MTITTEMKVGDIDLTEKKKKRLADDIEFCKRITIVGKRVIALEEHATERQTDGGVWIPETTTDLMDSRVGRILAVGEDVTVVQPGDRVLLSRYSGQTITLPELSNAHRIYLCGHEDVLAVLPIGGGKHAPERGDDRG